MSELAPVDWREVYGIWAYECGQSDRRTAEKTGIPQRTIYYHRTREDWGGRYVEDHYGLSETDLNLARIEIRALAKEGLQRRLRSIILDEVPAYTLLGEPILDSEGNQVMRWRASDKDAVNAMRIVTQYAIDPSRDSGQAAPLPAQFRVMDNGDLSEAEQAIAILEGNAQSVNTRIRKGRRT